MGDINRKTSSDYDLHLIGVMISISTLQIVSLI